MSNHAFAPTALMMNVCRVQVAGSTYYSPYIKIMSKYFSRNNYTLVYHVYTCLLLCNSGNGWKIHMRVYWLDNTNDLHAYIVVKKAAYTVNE